MNNQEYQMLASEITQIEEILQELPQDRWLEKSSFENRLKYLKEEIAKVEQSAIRHKAIITFRGSPVFGTHGILVDFASKASGALNEAVTSIAASLAENLRYMGPIPDRDKNKLLITNIARGSFGFELELPNNGEDSLIVEESNASKALDKMIELFENTLNENEDNLSELVQEIHPRAVKKVVEFLDTLKNSNAWFAFEYKNKLVKYPNIETITNTIKLLDENNINEHEESFEGMFQGVMPEGRTFEFKTNNKEIIKGKIGPDIKDPMVLVKEYLLKPATIKLKVTQVGQSKPKYMLLDITNIQVKGD
jgi:hypothetical protein